MDMRTGGSMRPSGLLHESIAVVWLVCRLYPGNALFEIEITRVLAPARKCVGQAIDVFELVDIEVGLVFDLLASIVASEHQSILS